MTPVVLLGGLNVVRALGLAGIPVIIASSERRTPAMASRYCAGTIELPPFTNRRAVVEALVSAGKRLGTRPPLFYDNDDRQALVQDFRDQLEPHFALLLNDPALGAALLDKSRFQAIAEAQGLPVPRRIAWETLERDHGPVLVKPKLRTAWEDSSVLRHLFRGVGKARVFENGRAAAAEPLVRSLASQLTFQEYVPGGDDAIWSFHGFITPEGALRASFVGRKLRSHPALTGDSSFLGLAHDDALVQLGKHIAARLGLVGIFKMDFKRNTASGRFHLLEINARFNLWHYLGAKNGTNLPQVAFSFFTKKDVLEKSKAQTHYRWLSLRFDWPAFRASDLTLFEWLWSLVERPKVYDVFSWSDPAPFLRRIVQRVQRRLARATPWRLPAK